MIRKKTEKVEQEKEKYRQYKVNFNTRREEEFCADSCEVLLCRSVVFMNDVSGF